MKRTFIGVSLLCLGSATFFSACSTKKATGESDKTGWAYNTKSYGGFEVKPYDGQETGPGLAFVQGGRFTMGQTEDNIPTVDNAPAPHTVSVSSFYMDETEVANVHYREYLYWLQRSYGADYQDQINKEMPDTTVWRRSLSFNEPLVQYYFRHAAYNFYPVVGVTWYQANDYCKWRSDRVNEQRLIKAGVLKPNPTQSNEDIYTTETYLAGQYEGTSGKRVHKDLDPNGSGKRVTSLSDGTFLPNYRLPTEAEWEYAALGNIGNNPEPENKRRRGEEMNTDRNSYPWGPRNSTRLELRNEHKGEFLGNFKRGKGDAMGVAGGLNDNADIPAPVNSYQPNAFGLYNMAGNVSEWTADTYRPTLDDLSDFKPFRGNVYEAYKYQEDGTMEEKDSLGHLQKRMIRAGELDSNMRYETRTADLRNYMDGDSASQYNYNYGNTTLVNDDSKVYKGGSWADRQYWLSPGSRRFMQANLSSATIGFRCVMDRLGSPNGVNSQDAGNYFDKHKKKRK